jgi:hypothetical protein
METNTRRSSESGVPSLPPEILWLIFSHLPLCDLKNIRLCSGSTKCIVEPNLFRDVVVVPHKESFESLVCLSEHSTLRHHVRKITYDNRWGDVALHLSLDVKENLDDESLKNALAALARGTICKGDTQDEIAYLSQALSSLPSLTSLWILECRAPNHDLDPLPTFYRRACELAGGDYDRLKTLIRHPYSKELAGGAPSALSALYATKTQVGDILVDPFDCELCRDESLVECMLFAFSSVRSLNLSFLRNALLLENHPISKLASILCNLRHVEYLHLDLEGAFAGGFCMGTDDVLHQKRVAIDSRSSLAQLLPSPVHFPSLKSLILCGLFATENELVDFLEQHSSTLSYLCLNGAMLAKPKGSDAVPCWVRTLKRVQTCLNLNKMCLERYLQNGSTQDWWVEDAGRPDSIKARMEDFIVHGGECPLENATAESPQSAYFLGDDSWYNEGIESVYDDDDEDEWETLSETESAEESEVSDWDSEGENIATQH